MARALRERRAENLDWEGIAEEMEDLGRSKETALTSHLPNLLSHMLNWGSRPTHRGKSWRRTIENSRDEVSELLERAPGLRPKLDDIFSRAYRKARRDAAAETDLDEETFPIKPPRDFAQATTEGFMPTGRSENNKSNQPPSLAKGLA